MISKGSVKKPNSTQAISKALIKQAIPRDVTVVPVRKAGLPRGWGPAFATTGALGSVSLVLLSN